MADNEKKEIVKILKVNAGDSATTIKELKSVISSLKKEVEGTDVSTKEYEAAVQKLAKAQSALKDITQLSADAQYKVADSADKGVKSYNQLNNQLRKLKTEWKATNDEARRTELTRQIAAVKDEMRGLDASIGNFHWNVGNYFNDIRSAMSGLPGPIGKVSGAVSGLSGSMSKLAANPAFLSLAVLSAGLASVKMAFDGVIERTQESETMMYKYAEATVAVRAAEDAHINVLDRMGDKVITLSGKLKGAWTNIKNFVSDVGLAIINGGGAVEGFMTFLAEKATQGVYEEIEKTVDALTKGYNESYRLSIVKQAQFNAQIAELRLKAADTEAETADRIAANRAAAEATNSLFAERRDLMEKEIALLEESAKATDNSVEVNNKLAEKKAALITLDAQRADALRALEKQYGTLNKAQQAFLEGLEDTAEIDAFDAEVDAAFSQMAEDIHNDLTAIVGDNDAMVQSIMEGAYAVELARQKEAQAAKDAEAQEKQSLQSRQAVMGAFVSGASSILGSLADVFDTQAKNDEDAERKAKALRIAGATIDTISGAIKAYMQGVATYPPPAGPIVGAANAAVVTATGLAQIAKIRATDVSATGTSNPNVQFAQVSAPAVVQEVQTVRSLTGDSEERRLDQMASNSKVYLVMSELEAKQKGQKVQMEESSF